MDYKCQFCELKGHGKCVQCKSDLEKKITRKPNTNNVDQELMECNCGCINGQIKKLYE